MCNKYNNVFAPGTLGSQPDTYLVPVNCMLGLGVAYQCQMNISLHTNGVYQQYREEPLVWHYYIIYSHIDIH